MSLNAFYVYFNGFLYILQIFMKKENRYACSKYFSLKGRQHITVPVLLYLNIILKYVLAFRQNTCILKITCTNDKCERICRIFFCPDQICKVQHLTFCPKLCRASSLLLAIDAQLKLTVIAVADARYTSVIATRLVCCSLIGRSLRTVSHVPFIRRDSHLSRYNLRYQNDIIDRTSISSKSISKCVLLTELGKLLTATSSFFSCLSYVCH